MIRVWKCDFCSQTDVDESKISQHEPKCSFNKANKKCYTCKFSYDMGYDYSIPACEINMNTYKGEEYGNCAGWIYEYIDDERDDKINKILD